MWKLQVSDGANTENGLCDVALCNQQFTLKMKKMVPIFFKRGEKEYFKDFIVLFLLQPLTLQ